MELVSTTGIILSRMRLKEQNRINMKKSKRKLTKTGRSGKFGTSSPRYNTGISRESVSQSATSQSETKTQTTTSSSAPKKVPLRKAGYDKFTDEQIASNWKLSTIKNALSTMSLKQARKNLKTLNSVFNMLPSANVPDSTKTRMASSSANAAYRKLSPEQKLASTIFYNMGGQIKNKLTGQMMGSGTVNTALYEAYGITPKAQDTSMVKVNKKKRK